MNTYILYIKSHCDFPDYENEIEAHNRKEAIEIFYKQLQREFDKDFINENMGRMYKNGKIR